MKKLEIFEMENLEGGSLSFFGGLSCGLGAALLLTPVAGLSIGLFNVCAQLFILDAISK